MSTKRSASRVRETYKFIEVNQKQHRVEVMCRVLGVARSGYYAWLQEPVSKRGQEDARLLRLIRASFYASHGIYGAPRVFLDLREAGETCSKHRVTRVSCAKTDCERYTVIEPGVHRSVSRRC
jgi:putative transposase